MTTATGESTLGWSIASNSFLMGNLNMGSATFVGGNMDEIFQAGVSGLISGAAMGGLTMWDPDNIWGYLAKRNIANNLDALLGEDNFKLSAGLISYNINQGNISTVFDKNMSLYERPSLGEVSDFVALYFLQSHC